MKIKYFILFTLAMISLFLLRDFTPDNELRYLSIADEALRNGTLFTFYNHGLAYADKPPLYLWIVMAGKLIFGTHSMLFLGLFSLLPALVILYVMDKWTAGVLERANRSFGLLLLMSSAYFLASAAVMRMDMLMCMFIVLALFVFYRMYCGETHWRNKILFPLYVFLALFTKGPIGFLVPLLSVIAFLVLQRELKTLGRYWGWITWSILIVLCGSWFVAVYAEGGAAYLHNLLFNQTINRAVDAFHHKRPVYYYFISMWYVVAPWSLLIAGILIASVKRKLVTTDMERFFLTVAVVIMVMLSLISSKVDIYLLPALPFLVYLTVLLLQKLPTQCGLLRGLLATPVLLITLAVPVGCILLQQSHWAIPSGVWVYVAGVFVTVLGTVTLWLLFQKADVRKAGSLFAVGMLVTLLVVSPLIPAMNSSIGYGAMCETGKQLAQQNQSQAFWFYNIRRGENMDVYLHQEAVELTDDTLKQLVSARGILFCRADDVTKNRLLQHIVSGKPQVTKGEYVVVALR
ncbi:MAG: Undecaprenyl phosphate-alpha-4-amino-4-deoxy-L-arabinose arabinosyl transferase [Bacteroidetes bacterium]|nr:Undecaprenyl phosphate-alpha-4-amino-4-deoxy-L-arabinose arabinosyl transferase [Bacteroidota bacterium]